MNAHFRCFVMVVIFWCLILWGISACAAESPWGPMISQAERLDAMEAKVDQLERQITMLSAQVEKLSSVVAAQSPVPLSAEVVKVVSSNAKRLNEFRKWALEFDRICQANDKLHESQIRDLMRGTRTPGNWVYRKPSGASP